MISSSTPAPFNKGEFNIFHSVLVNAGLTPAYIRLTPDTKIPNIGWRDMRLGDPPRCLIGRDPVIGILTGHRSGRVNANSVTSLVAIDIDDKPHEGTFGRKVLAEYEATYGALPPTLTVVSPSGGEHRYFVTYGAIITRAPAFLGSAKGLDVRGEGGQIVVPGSAHTRGTYRVVNAVPPAPFPLSWSSKLARRDGLKEPGLPNAKGGTRGGRPGGGGGSIDLTPTRPDDEVRADILARCAGIHHVDYAAFWRRVALCEPALRANKATEPAHLPVASDDFLTKAIWALAAGLELTPGDFVEAVAPTLGLLAVDDLAHGNPAYSVEALAEKWVRGMARVAAVKADNRRFADRLIAANRKVA